MLYSWRLKKGVLRSGVYSHFFVIGKLLEAIHEPISRKTVESEGGIE
jgi:hypothetical protein